MVRTMLSRPLQLLLLVLVLAMVRSQDAAAVTTLLQQQAAAIQSLQSEVASLKAVVQTLQKNESDLSTVVHNIQQQRVSFSAHMSDTHVLAGDLPLIFNVVLNNEGGAYNETTGVFTAPYKGTYVFHFLVVNDEHSPFVQITLMQGNGLPGYQGRNLAVGTADGGPNNSYDDASGLVTVHLFPGDVVFVKRNTGALYVYGDVFCTFSGFLLSHG